MLGNKAKPADRCVLDEGGIGKKKFFLGTISTIGGWHFYHTGCDFAGTTWNRGYREADLTGYYRGIGTVSVAKMSATLRYRACLRIIIPFTIGFSEELSDCDCDYKK